ncbi:MAG: hypothetical protein ACHWZW_20235 [Spirulina sp.]
MAPKKLTEADKVAILGLYRQPEETTSTLAERYGVSNSTISRLLKASLPEAEYKRLIQQKRGSSDRGSDSVAAQPVDAPASAPAPDPTPSHPEDSPSVDSAPVAKVEGSKAPPILKKRGSTPEAPEATDVATPSNHPADTVAKGNQTADSPDGQGKTRRRRSRSASAAPESSSEDATQLALSTEATAEDSPEEATEDRSTPAPSRPELIKKGPIKKGSVAKADVPDAASVASDWEDEASDLDDDYAEDDDDDEDDEDAWDGDTSELAPHLEAVEIIPLTPSDLPAQCYLVVERVSSELVVLPLKTFASLGQIPEEEGDLRTLPVFDNHRVARRFSRRNQRVIKVPDGNLLQTTRPYLQAKGISRLLIDGQVFALEE